MDVFWIPHLTILMLLHQTMSASDTKEVNGVLGRSVTFQSRNPDRMTALWFFGNEAIVTVIFDGPPRPAFHKEEFKTRFSVSKSGHALTISQLRMEDAGTYSVTINGKRSAFSLQVFRELAEPTVTCEAQNCSGGSCSSSLRCSAHGGNVSYTWRVRGRTWDGSSVVLLVNQTSQDGLETVMCSARNPVSSRSIIVTNLGELCAGALSSGQVGVRAGVGVIAGILVLVLLLIFLMVLWKSKVPGATNDYTTVYAEVGPSQQVSLGMGTPWGHPGAL
ncbi:SLAM family member 5-like [Melospiza melodia melodia]|uniref:SLAM family member 5-like n=1 Tax=Melospiza melodia melodia TaxID=1914991 RepID=UPI002FCFA163